MQHEQVTNQINNRLHYRLLQWVSDGYIGHSDAKKHKDWELFQEWARQVDKESRKPAPDPFIRYNGVVEEFKIVAENIGTITNPEGAYVSLRFKRSHIGGTYLPTQEILPVQIDTVTHSVLGRIKLLGAIGMVDEFNLLENGVSSTSGLRTDVEWIRGLGLKDELFDIAVSGITARFWAEGETEFPFPLTPTSDIAVREQCLVTPKGIYNTSIDFPNAKSTLRNGELEDSLSSLSKSATLIASIGNIAARTGSGVFHTQGT